MSGWLGEFVPAERAEYQRAVAVVEAVVNQTVESFELSLGNQVAAKQHDVATAEALSRLIEATSVRKQAVDGVDGALSIPNRPVARVRVRGSVRQNAGVDWTFERLEGWGDTQAGEEMNLMERVLLVLGAHLIERLDQGA